MVLKSNGSDGEQLTQQEKQDETWGYMGTAFALGLKLSVKSDCCWVKVFSGAHVSSCN